MKLLGMFKMLTMQTTAEFASNSTANIKLSKRPSFFLLTSNKFFYEDYKCGHQKSMWRSSCSENTQKTNLWQFFLQCCRLQDSNFNRNELHYGDLLEKFEENNLAKVSFLKLLTQKNLLVCFH